MHRCAWFVLLLCGLLFWSTGCTRLRVNSGPYLTDADADPPIAPQMAAAGVVFTAFQSSGDARRQLPFTGEVLTQLWLLRDGRRELVHRDMGARWSRLDLIPGEYELELVEIYDGDRASPPNDENLSAFTVTPGTTAQVNLVLNQVPWGTIAVATLSVVVVVGLVVLAIVAHDAPNSRGGHQAGTHTIKSPPPRPRVPRGRPPTWHLVRPRLFIPFHVIVADLEPIQLWSCLLYTSDAADE